MDGTGVYDRRIFRMDLYKDTDRELSGDISVRIYRL